MNISLKDAEATVKTVILGELMEHYAARRMIFNEDFEHVAALLAKAGRIQKDLEGYET